MGCGASIPKKCKVGGKGKKRRSVIQEVAVFVPTIRIPVDSDVAHPLRGLVSKELVDRLSKFRARVVALSEEIYCAGVSDVSELQHALDEYLPVVLGLTTKESRLESSVEFRWRTLDDDQECCLSSAWYEVLSVIHMMAMLALFEANLILIPKNGQVGGERKVSEDAKKDVVDSLLRASGCLDYCVHRILVQIPAQVKKSFPSYLQEGMLEAISIQALAQCVEIQLGLASECEKATLSVKRRLACELVSYFSQAHYCLSGCNTSDSFGKKLLLFLKWKCMEAKAVAYYYHGLVLDKGNEASSHISAVCCLSAADDLVADSKRACLSFCLANPITRVPPPWGIMRNMHKKIPDAACKRFQMYGYLFEQDKNSALQSLPDLPEFALSLRPEGYELPSTDSIWDNVDSQPQIQSLKEHLDDEDEVLRPGVCSVLLGIT
uniref:BRO1 domain-containing protein n=1 Tax=Oryza punctata TaxID=4537 RepID=A0A0E0MFS7_ORYPU